MAEAKTNYDKLLKISDMECTCPDEDFDQSCPHCVASSALNLSAEVLRDAIDGIESTPEESK